MFQNWFLSICSPVYQKQNDQNKSFTILGLWTEHLKPPDVERRQI